VNALRAGLALITLLVLQTTLIADLPLFGVRGDLVLLAAIAGGILYGADRAAIVGFAVGFGYDLLVSQTPLGLYALTYCLIGYGVGTIQGSVLRSSWWIPVGSAFAASFAGVTLFALLGTVLGQEGMLGDRLWRVALVVALVNAALILPALRVLRWVLPVESRTPRLSL
jgi:rod shape-determining protein MreD